jgi:hypothetical protein
MDSADIYARAVVSDEHEIPVKQVQFYSNPLQPDFPDEYDIRCVLTEIDVEPISSWRPEILSYFQL